MYPNLFRIGPLTVHTYGVFLALAFLLGLRMAIYYAKRENINTGYVSDLVLYIFVSALLGAKILHLIVDYDYYAEDWHRLFGIFQIGGVYYGGLVLAILVSLWYVRRKKMDFWQTADVLIMGVAFGQILGRTGCFFAGCCWGKEAPAGFVLAVTFRNALAAQQVGTPLGIPLHPSQLYEAVPMIGVFLLLAYSYNHRKFVGQQLCFYLLLYAILRFVVEFFRGDPRGSVFHGLLSTSQLISLFALAAGIVIFAFRRRAKTEA